MISLAHHEITIGMLAFVTTLVAAGYVGNLLYRWFIRPFIKEDN